MAKKKTDWGNIALQSFLTGAGMFAGSQITNVAERNIMPSDMAPYSGAVTAVAGGAAAGFLPKDAKPVAVGIAAQGIADVGESLLNMAMASTANGGSNDTNAQGSTRTLRNPAVGNTQAGGRRMNPRGRRAWASKKNAVTA